MVCLIEHPSICTRNMELKVDLYVPLSVVVLQPISYHYIPNVRSYIDVTLIVPVAKKITMPPIFVVGSSLIWELHKFDH